MRFPPNLIPNFGIPFILHALKCMNETYYRNDFPSASFTRYNDTALFSAPPYTIKSTDDNLTITIRSSADPADYETDTSFTEIRTRYGWIHSGFYRAACYIESEVDDFVSNFKGPIYLFGHSYGGSVATVLFVILKSMFPDKEIYCFTFNPVPSISSIPNRMVSYISTLWYNNDIVTCMSIPNIVKAIRKYIPIISLVSESTISELIFKLLGKMDGSEYLIELVRDAVPEAVRNVKQYIAGAKRYVVTPQGCLYHFTENINSTKVEQYRVDPYDQVSLTFAKNGFTDHFVKSVYTRLIDFENW